MSTRSAPSYFAKTSSQGEGTSPTEMASEDKSASPPGTSSKGVRVSPTKVPPGKSSGFILFPVNDITVKAHTYFHSEIWHKIEEIVIEALNEKGFDATVRATTLDYPNGPRLEGTKPTISICAHPEKEDNDADSLKDAIFTKLKRNGFEEPIDIYFESFKRPARHIPPPIDTSLTHKKVSSSMSTRPSPFPLLSPFEPANKYSGRTTGFQIPSVTFAPSTPTPSIDNKNSVKHLTCWYWLTKGQCRKSDEDCAYSHFDTGKHAEQPRPLIPGAPAVAGKNAERVQASIEQSHHSYADSYPSAANELRFANYTPASQHYSTIYGSQGQPLMSVYNHSQVPYSAPLVPAQASYLASLGSTQRSLMPMPDTSQSANQFPLNNPRSSRNYMDTSHGAPSTAERRLTVGAGRPVRNAPDNKLPVQAGGASGSNINHVGSPFINASISMPTPSTATMGPNSAAFSGPLSAPLSTPSTGLSFGNNVGNNNSNSIAACRELCSALDYQVNNLHELNRQLGELGRKYPSVHVQMAPIFEIIKRTLESSVEKRANAQVLMRGDPLLGYVFGNAENVGNAGGTRR